MGHRPFQIGEWLVYFVLRKAQSCYLGEIMSPRREQLDDARRVMGLPEFELRGLLDKRVAKRCDFPSGGHGKPYALCCRVGMVGHG
jgi:hypothetical protein